LTGEPLGPPWDAADWDGDNDWEIASAADDTPEQLYALWDGAVERSRARLDAALADGGMDQLIPSPVPTVAMPTCAGSCVTSLRSTADTLGMPTCSARQWTAGSVKTLRLDGTPETTRCRRQGLPRPRTTRVPSETITRIVSRPSPMLP